MSISKVKVDERHERLMMALGDTIQKFTQQTPMTHESIVGVLAFCTGAAIGQAKTRGERFELRKMADANVDYGTHAVTGSAASSRLILPEHVA
ncbi:hypothetical protein HGP16_25490 [Rhizobium sp. P40RR-XXII]|uniref:hypothetical protein n=1 Tax=Rhizobium sp. P40RR-XXII TaxID=2726739 RepID=UPI00145769BA|nr:hypothetical protein [Rhizobium sp. P40RR-XXII]NLS19896.1 hypothetical protein [Rhizobium sp. P40RR-XXII]